MNWFHEAKLIRDVPEEVGKTWLEDRPGWQDENALVAVGPDGVVLAAPGGLLEGLDVILADENLEFQHKKKLDKYVTLLLTLLHMQVGIERKHDQKINRFVDFDLTVTIHATNKICLQLRLLSRATKSRRCGEKKERSWKVWH